MNYLIIGFLFVGLAAGQEPKLLKSTSPAKASATAADKKDLVEQEYDKLMEQDEAALKDVEKMSTDFQAFQEKGVAGSRAALSAKISQRLEPVRKAYDDFLMKHSGYVPARLAYGSFLNEIGEEEDAIVQWERARELDPKNPSAWNNLANSYAHIGPVKKAFQYYEKAVELNPLEPIYLQNLATTTYLFRKDAAESYRTDEEGVFNKALELYRRAMKLDPANVVLATDYAQSFYGIRPMRVDDALAAWKHALTLSKSDAEKEGIYLHLARVELNSGRFTDAEQHLALVSNPDMLDLRNRLRRNLERKRSGTDTTEEKAEKPAEKKELTTTQ